MLEAEDKKYLYRLIRSAVFAIVFAVEDIVMNHVYSAKEHMDAFDKDAPKP